MFIKANYISTAVEARADSDIRFEERTAPTVMKPTDAHPDPGYLRVRVAPVALQGHQPRRGVHFSSLPYGWRSAT